MKNGYTEWISTGDKDMRIGFITNPFGRVLYINHEWPEGKYQKWYYPNKLKDFKGQFKKGRTFNKEDLMLELL